MVGGLDEINAYHPVYDCLLPGPSLSQHSSSGTVLQGGVWQAPVITESAYGFLKRVLSVCQINGM
jgi:hypothetical protein